MTWAPAVTPSPAPSWLRASWSVVADASVTAFDRTVLASLDPPRRSMTGAVHDADGALVTDSQRTWTRHNPPAPVAADPATRPLDALRAGCPHRLAGRWVYAGHWSHHFGHFLVEVVPTLWPDPDDPAVRGPDGIAGVLVHRSFRGGPDPLPHRPSGPVRVLAWQQSLLDLAGYGDLPVVAVRGDGVAVEELVVATRPVVFRAHARPEAVALWRRLGDRATAQVGAVGAVGAAGPRRVFLSRSAFNQTPAADDHHRTSDGWDRHLDEVFAGAGFAVVRPETLPVVEQVALARGAEVLAGSSGSALHLSAVAGPGCRVLEVGDARDPLAPQTSQTMVDAAVGRETAFVAHEDDAALRRVLAGL